MAGGAEGKDAISGDRRRGAGPNPTDGVLEARGVSVGPKGCAGEKIAADDGLVVTLLLESDGVPAVNGEAGKASTNLDLPNALRRMRFPVLLQSWSGDDAIAVRSEELREASEVFSKDLGFAGTNCGSRHRERLRCAAAGLPAGCHNGNEVTGDAADAEGGGEDRDREDGREKGDQAGPPAEAGKGEQPQDGEEPEDQHAFRRSSLPGTAAAPPAWSRPRPSQRISATMSTISGHQRGRRVRGGSAVGSVMREIARGGGR